VARSLLVCGLLPVACRLKLVAFRPCRLGLSSRSVGNAPKDVVRGTLAVQRCPVAGKLARGKELQSALQRMPVEVSGGGIILRGLWQTAHLRGAFFEQP